MFNRKRQTQSRDNAEVKTIEGIGALRVFFYEESWEKVDLIINYLKCLLWSKNTHTHAKKSKTAETRVWTWMFKAPWLNQEIRMNQLRINKTEFG